MVYIIRRGVGMDKLNLTAEEWHKKEAVDNFNKTWELIDKTNRSHEDTIEMIHRAHASRYHWGQIGTPLEFLRGEWQISRVYALTGIAESAILHGKESLRLCRENKIGGFDLAFAYEAVARAYHVINDTENVVHYLKLAKDATNEIANPEDREYLISELQTIT